MKINKKMLFLAAALVTVLILISAVNATNTTDKSIDNTISEKTSTPTSKVIKEETTTKEKIETQTNKEIKKTNKTEKSTKTSTKTVEVNNFTELQNTITSAVRDAENDVYIINLNDGNYTFNRPTSFNPGGYYPNININGNNQTIIANPSMRYIRFNSLCNITINNVTMNHTLTNMGNNITLIDTIINLDITNNMDCNLIIKKSLINSTINNEGILTLADDVIFGENFGITGEGQLLMNNTSKLAPYLSVYDGNFTLENCLINSEKTNNGNLTLKNCTVSSTITNRGNLIIDDDTIFEGEWQLSGSGSIYMNDSNRIYPKYNSYYGVHKLSNTSLDNTFNNYGNITIENSSLNAKLTNFPTGNVTFNNSTLNAIISNSGKIIISDDTQFTSNFSYYGYTKDIEIDDMNRILPYFGTYEGDNTIQNALINTEKTNKGNLTLKKCIINATITNNGNLIIDDDTIFGQNFIYKGTGNITINNTNRLLPYLDSFNDSFLENITFKHKITFTGNNTMINCTIENTNVLFGIILNRGNLTMINCTIKNNNGNLINNQGNLTIKNVIIENNTFSGTLIDGFIYTQYNSGTMLIENLTFTNNFINATYGTESNTVYGFINCNNNNLISLKDSIFVNNTAYVKKDGTNIDSDTQIFYGVNNANISNCIFENNTASAIVGSYVNISDSKFINNNRVVNGRIFDGTLVLKAVVDLNGINNIEKCTFTDNFLNITNPQASVNSAGAIRISRNNSWGAVAGGTIIDSKFANNGIECNSVWLTVNGAAISGTNLTITDNNFTANYINTVKGTSASTESYEFDFTSSGYGVDICADGTTTITGNNFINSTGNQDVGSIYSSDENSVIEITNNNFVNCKANKETIAVISENKNIADNTFTNCSIGFKTLNLTAPSKVYSNEDVSVSLNVELAYPDNYDADLLEKTDYTWHINGENTTTKDTTKTVSVGTSNVIVYVTPTVSNNRTRVLSLIPTVLTDVVITPENINNYLVMGELQVNPNTKVIFQGTFTDIGEINNNKNEVLFDGSNATFTNTYFTIEANDNTIQNMNINNKDTSNYIIQNTGNNTVIKNNILTQYNTNGQTAAIKDSNSKNTIITQNTITVTGPAKDVMSEGGVRIANTQAILSKNTTQSTITYNNITVNNSTNPELASFTTIEAITAPQSNKNQISYNNIQCTGARFNYGIDLLNNVDENEISYNNITATGYRYCDGIQIGDNATNNLITNNNIKITCLNTTPVDEAAISYGIIVTSQGGLKADNNTITQNNIEINGIVNYGIEIYTASNTPITDNTITLNGAKSMGIGYAHSPNSTVTGNTINTNDDSSIPINGITEEIQPLNTGILTQQDSDNILIENNTIQTYDKQGQDTCIKIESSNVTIKNNNLTSSTQTGDNTITTTQPDTTTIENNNAIQQNSTTQTTTEDLTVGDSTTITAQFYDDTYTPVADGKAIFRVNGKTLRDDQGNVIYADVINGRVELPDVNITQEWTKDDTTIQAIYVGNDNNAPITTTPTTVTVTKPEATITLDAPTTATAGQEITLKATVTDGDTAITSGRVAFKLNGKTLKNTDGKALYAEVNDGIATITYTIPAKTKAKEYVLTAVFTDAKYDRKDANSTLTVVKA